MDVVEGPRRNRFASRGAAAMCAGLAFTLAGGSAWGAACIPASDLVALRTAALQQQLAVAALQCNRAEEFGRFVQVYGEPLRGADAMLLDFFKKRNAASGAADHSAFKNSLAKLWAVSSSKDNVDFCANAEVAFRMANNTMPVPLHAIAANIPAGRYVACAPGVNSPKQTLTASAERKTQVASAEPAKAAPARILREDAVRDTLAARNRPAVAKAQPAKAALSVATAILPMRKPLVIATAIIQQKEKKPAPVVAKAAPKPIATAAAGPGVPLSQYAMTAARAESQVPPRSPYEASPEELMTEADLPPDGTQNAPPLAAPNAKVAKANLVPKTETKIVEQRVAELPIVEKPVVQERPALRQPVQVAEAMAPEEIVEAAWQTQAAEQAPWVAEQYVRPESYGPQEQRIAPRETYRRPAMAEARDYYEPPDDRNRPYAQEYAPREDRYGNASPYYRQEERTPRDYRDRTYEEPRYTRPPQRPMRERYAYAPDYGDTEYDRYDTGYSQREDRYHDPYYGR